LNDREPQPPPLDDSFDEVPLELKGFPAAIATWKRLAPMLRRCRQITQADRDALVALCLEWWRYLDAMKRIRKQGLVVKTKKSGYPMPNPYLPIATKALANCARLWPELGLTPSGRSRVKVADGSGPGPDGDAFSEFDVAPGSSPGVRAH
jgi:P27 family predicted phage terminase small subunit